jgi:mono/diheme cytochrome c family protein
MSTLSKSPHAQSSLLIPGILVASVLTVLALVLIVQIHPLNAAKPAVVSVLDSAAVKAGRTTFLTVCAACHGPKATGIKGLGKPLIGSVFFNGHTDAELLAFIQKGRPVNDPLNTTGVMMPARGGRPSLTDDDLKNVIAYIRSLNTK